MKKFLDILKTYHYAIIWTVFYVFITWAILFFMFKFNIFTSAHWHRLAHAHLRGFPGFVFGILILSAVPLYIATTTLIVRTKKPLITIPLPKIKFKRATPAPSPITPIAPQPDTAAPTNQHEIPDEMRHNFARAQHKIKQFESYNNRNITTKSDTPVAPESAPIIDTIASDLPLPTDFDIDIADNFSPTAASGIPVFSDINFDSDASAPEPPHPNQIIIDYLKSHDTDFTTDHDVIITNTYAIIAHIDNDFWATDDDNWFATGKTKTSPISLVKSVATKHHVTPVIYLGAQNILDIDTLIPKWESDGIIVITDLNKIQ